jgi:hypothetical protein
VQSSDLKLRCRWFPWTGCRETFDLDQGEAWTQHHLDHYRPLFTKGTKAYLGPTMRCWIDSCDKIVTAQNEGVDDFKERLLRNVMLHVRYTHMAAEDIQRHRFWIDEHFTILGAWPAIEAARDAGAIDAGTFKALDERHHLPRNSGWVPVPEAVPEEDQRGNWGTHDQEREDRERRRHDRAARGKGKAVDMGEASSRGSGGGRA